MRVVSGSAQRRSPPARGSPGGRRPTRARPARAPARPRPPGAPRPPCGSRRPWRAAPSPARSRHAQQHHGLAEELLDHEPLPVALALAPQHPRHALLEGGDRAHHELGHGIGVDALGARDHDVGLTETRLPQVVDPRARELDPAEPRGPLHDLGRDPCREQDLSFREQALVVNVRPEVRVVQPCDVDPVRGGLLGGHDGDAARLPANDQARVERAHPVELLLGGARGDQDLDGLSRSCHGSPRSRARETDGTSPISSDNLRRPLVPWAAAKACQEGRGQSRGRSHPDLPVKHLALDPSGSCLHLDPGA